MYEVYATIWSKWDEKINRGKKVANMKLYFARCIQRLLFLLCSTSLHPVISAGHRAKYNVIEENPNDGTKTNNYNLKY